MKGSAVLLALSMVLRAVEIPAGTNLEVRLTTSVSTLSSHVQDKVEGILIAPVAVGEVIAIPLGAIVIGTVTAVSPASETKSALLRLQFTQVVTGRKTFKMTTRLSGVDNVRETVDENGTVQGISPKDTITGRMDQGLGKLSAGPLGGLAQVLGVAKGLLLKNADPNIVYEAGTELTLRLNKPLAVKSTTPNSSLPQVSDDGHLSELVNNQVAQTYAVHPPRPSDVTNLMFIGSLDQIREAFREAGWVGADTLNGETKWQTALAIIEQRGFNEAPVSTLLLDHRVPELVLQKANNTFSARHHLRIWRSLDTYQGQAVWLGSATHDIGIDYSERDRTFIHKIDSNIDLERAKVVSDLLFTGKVRSVALVERPAVPRHSENATGDDINTDGSMAVVLLR